VAALIPAVGLTLRSSSASTATSTSREGVERRPFAWGAVGAIVLSVIGGLAFEFAVSERWGRAEAGDAAGHRPWAPLVEEEIQGHRPRGC
jgi:hypothetical protein